MTAEVFVDGISAGVYALELEDAAANNAKEDGNEP